MFISNHMTTPVITVPPTATLTQARQILLDHHFRHLPVVDQEKRLIGMVTDRDLRSAMSSSLLAVHEKLPLDEKIAASSVDQIMTPVSASLWPEATLDDALVLFDRTRVGALPVVDNERRLVGLLSIRDLLAAYRTLFGLGEKGTALVTVEDDGAAHPLSRLTATLENNDIPFSRLLRCGTMLHIRVHTYNLRQVHSVLAAAGFAPVTQFPRLHPVSSHGV